MKKTFRFYLRMAGHSIGTICRRRLLAAAVLVLCAILPVCIGPAVEHMFADGVDFSGITLAVTAPQGDDTPELLEQYMGKMRDVSKYCSFRALPQEEAVAALERGEVTAVLVLPDGFLNGVLGGENPAVELIVSADRPLESLLTLWVGQSAADLLTAAQEGVYAVLDAVETSGVKTIPEEQLVTEINMKYLSWTLDREDLFRVRQVSAIETLPIHTHYSLSLLVYLAMALAPVFFDLYSPSRLQYVKRLRSAGRTDALSLAADLTACSAVLVVICLIPVAAITGAPLVSCVFAAVVIAVFCAVFGSFCCLLASGAANAGILAFAVSLISLAAAGGIVPPVLLPAKLRQLGAYSPVHWLRTVAAAAGKYKANGVCNRMILGSLVLMLPVCLWLYCRRVGRREVAQ